MHCVGCWVVHSMVAYLGGMVVNMGDSSFSELSSNTLSSDSEYELSSPLADTIDVINVVGVSIDTSSHASFEVYEQSLHSRDDHDDIPLCVGFRREQWICLDVIIHKELGVIVADDIYRNSDPYECVDANPLDVNDVGVCIVNSLLLFEVPLTWKFSLNRWPLHSP